MCVCFAGSNPGHGKTTIIKIIIIIIIMIIITKTFVLTTNSHLKTGVDSAPETLCEKHFR